MDWLIWVVTGISLSSNCVLTFAVYRIVKIYQKKQDKLYEEYLREAKALDDMAGLLEVLFDIKNPKERKPCIQCSSLYQCLAAGRLPANYDACLYFKRRGN